MYIAFCTSWQYLKRWANIEPTLGERLDMMCRVFISMSTEVSIHRGPRRLRRSSPDDVMKDDTLSLRFHGRKPHRISRRNSRINCFESQPSHWSGSRSRPMGRLWSRFCTVTYKLLVRSGYHVRLGLSTYNLSTPGVSGHISGIIAHHLTLHRRSALCLLGGVINDLKPRSNG